MVSGVGDWVAQSSERLRLLLAEIVEAAISIAVAAIGLVAFGVRIAAIGPAVLVALAGARLWAVVMVLSARSREALGRPGRTDHARGPPS